LEVEMYKVKKRGYWGWERVGGGVGVEKEGVGGEWRGGRGAMIFN